jgi:hypothetical protein
VVVERIAVGVRDADNELKSTLSHLCGVWMKKHCCLVLNCLDRQEWLTMTDFSVFCPPFAGSRLVNSQAVTNYFAIPAESLSDHHLHVLHAVDAN